jgi:hypothetical protein
MVVKKQIDAEGAEDKGEEGGDISNEVGGDFGGEEEGDEKDAGEVGGFSHATQEAGATVLLPDGEEGAAEVFGDVELGVEVVPAGEKGAGFVVEIDEEAGDKEEGDDRPVLGEEFAQMAKLPEGETVFGFGNILGHKLV